MRLSQYQKKKTTIRSVIQEVKKSGVDEIIVVANGADVETIKQAKLENVIVIEFEGSAWT